MSAAAALPYDFSPVQAMKNIWEQADLALFTAGRELEKHDPIWPVHEGALLYSDPKGELVLDDSAISRMMRMAYGGLPVGRYRIGPRNATTYGSARWQDGRFWPIGSAPYVVADLALDRIASLALIVAEATNQNTLHGYNAKSEELVKQQLMQEFDGSDDQWKVIRSLIRLTNELAAELQIGCRKGIVETCDLMRDFRVVSCVTSESAIAYMRSIGSCNIPEAVTPRAKINWQTNEAARLALWNDFQKLDRNKTKLAKKWGITRAAVDRPLELAEAEFGYRPNINTDNWGLGPTTGRIKGTRY